MSSHALPANAEHLFRYLFEQASLGIAVEDLDGKILVANPALCSMLGYRDDELAGMNCSQFANSKDSQDDWALFERLRAGAIDHYSIEKRYVKKDGAPLWGRLNVSLLKENNGEPPLVFAFVENITEHKLAEEALHQKDKELTEVQGRAGIGSWSWDARTDRVIWSKEISLRAGYDPSMPAPNLKDQASFFTAESWNRLQQSVQEALQTGTSYEIDLELVNPLSGVRWATTRGEPLRDADGQIIGLRGTIQDITEHKLAEQELARINERFRLAMEASKSVGWEWDIKTGTDSWFGDLQTMFGIPSDSFVGRVEDFYRRVHPEDQARVAKAVADARQNGQPYAAEFQVIRPDGTVRWVDARGTFHYTSKGEPIRMLGMATDITERKRAEEKLRESEDRLRLAVQAGKMYAFDWDVATDVIVRSKESVNILNWTNPEHDTGREFHTRVHPEDAAIYATTEAGLTPDNPTYQINFRMLDLDGNVTWLEDTGRASFDAHGKMVRVIGMVADITERKRAEQALRESEDRLRLLLDSTAEAIYGVDLYYRCTFCNPSCLRLLGYRQVDEVLGKNMHDLIHHTRADGTPLPVEECRIHRVAQTGEGSHAEDEVLWRANGTSFPVEYWSYPQRRGQEVIGAVVAFIDITERKLAEAALANVSRKLIEAQEQERTRIGRELHDDIGQRLALVAVELQQLHKEALVFPRVRSRLGELQKKVSQIAADTQSLSHELHSARLQYLGITAAMRGFCREFGEQQKVKVEFKANDLPTALSPDISLCLFRVLQEALHNSAKHSEVRRFEVRLWGKGDEIRLTVKDSGKGFDREAAKTTQGLGLISMEERLKMVNGTLSIESQPRRGTTIEAHVPLGSGSESLRAAG